MQLNAFPAKLSQLKFHVLYCSNPRLGNPDSPISDAQVSGGYYSSDALDIGMGIRPDLTGQGLGKLYAQAVAGYGANRYGAKHLQVTIAVFNQRAQRVGKQLGFEQVETFIKLGGEEEFVVMTCAV